MTLTASVLLFTMSTIPSQPDAQSAGNIQFLKLPFEKGVDFEISEGWFYSREEREIHGKSIHSAIDYAVPYGTPVYAAADGFVIASSNISQLEGTFKGKKVGYSYGNFVRVWHPEAQLFTQYGHLSKISPDIPFDEPKNIGKAWIPTSLFDRDTDSFEKDGFFVRQGYLIGYAGDSGLSWGYDEKPLEERNRDMFPSWDEPHVHFEVFSKEPRGNTRKFIDPYGIYGQASEYLFPINTKKGLWLLSDNGKPRFAH